MEINRSNYEIWFIDWFDGNLNELQIEQLNRFISENPDLKEEFNELNSLILKPSEISFRQKEQLEKSVDDLSESQFELLCVAYLERDLTSCQQTELNEITDRYPEKKRSFEIIQKMRLVPGVVRFNHKKKLIKITPAQKVSRLSAILLSAAATVALIVVIFFKVPQSLQDKNRTSQNKVVDSTLLRPSVTTTVSEEDLQDLKTVIKKQKRENLLADVKKNSSAMTRPDSTPSNQNDSRSPFRNSKNQEIQIIQIPVASKICFTQEPIANNLIPVKYAVKIQEYDDGRSKLSRFIAKTFREKILREKVTKDTPLRAYEIAEAGIAGLNKLLGWEMALDEKKDENGELQSVYFSSKILKFNAPVKKN